MPFEVEQKFPLLTSPAEIEQRLIETGAVRGSRVFQQDLYFNHPARDFAATDEAFRIRTVGEQNFVTYKGPKLDLHVKTRQEIEIPLGDGLQTAEQFGQILTLLGFKLVLPVRKHRTIWTLQWEQLTWEIDWDEVEGLGHFLEIETIAENQSQIPQIQQTLLRLAEWLCLREPQRKSYLEMLLEQKILTTTPNEKLRYEPKSSP